MNDIEGLLQSINLDNVKIPLKVENKILYSLNNLDSSRKEAKIKKILQFIVSLIITMVSTTGICFATVQIYNEYIKKQETIESRGLFDTGDGISNFDTDLRQNDMIWDDKNRFFYKIINNYTDYMKYKERLSILPEMLEQDFEYDFLLIITWQTERELHEADLEVSRIESNDTTTNIILKQKQSPNYNSENNIIYAVISNEELKNEVNIKVEVNKSVVTGYTNIDELPSDYSIEDAIDDGCFVISNGEVKSKDIYLIDKFIEDAENNKNCFLRIYNREDYEIRQATYICDIEYKDGVFYETKKNITNSIEKEEYFHSYEKLLKREGLFGTEYLWVLKKEDLENKKYLAYPLVFIK